MADEAMATFIGLAGKIIYRGEREARIAGAIDGTRLENGGVAKPGMMLTETGETWPDLAPAAAGETVWGIALEDPTTEFSADTNTAWADNSPIRVLRFPFETCEVWCIMDQTSGAALAEGDFATIGATAGSVTNVTADYDIDTCGRFTTRDAAGSTDLRIERVIFG